jgi:hypothetical protein
LSPTCFVSYLKDANRLITSPVYNNFARITNRDGCTASNSYSAKTANRQLACPGFSDGKRQAVVVLARSTKGG